MPLLMYGRACVRACLSTGSTGLGYVVFVCACIRK